MPIKYELSLVPVTSETKLKTLVENRTVYSLEHCELNVFETHMKSYAVPLTFSDFVVTSMVRGKKVMHMYDNPGFDYVPGETVIVPPDVTMKIDFPEATGLNPTQCIALAIDETHIRKTLQYLNEYLPKEFIQNEWSLDYDKYHLYNNEDIALLINKLIRICSDNSKGKNVLADLAVKELLIRMMQTQNMIAVDNNFQKESTANPLAFIVQYIKENINEKIQISELSDKACMSKASFFRAFKKELGVSPLEYILKEKLNRAKELLANPNIKVTAISYELGFNDLNYFVRLFRQKEGITPRQYQSKFVS